MIKWLVLVLIALIACTGEEHSGTDVETQIDEQVNPKDSLDPWESKDTIEVKDSVNAKPTVPPDPWDAFDGKRFRVLLEEAPMVAIELSFWDSTHTPIEGYIENQGRTFYTDSMGYVSLHDSLGLGSMNLYVNQDSSGYGVLQPFSKIEQVVELKKNRHFWLRVESEFIYGEGVADSAFFYVAGSPLVIQCSLEEKLFANIPAQINKINVINKTGEELQFQLPENLPDTTRMLLKERELHLFLEETVVLQSTVLSKE